VLFVVLVLHNGTDLRGIQRIFLVAFTPALDYAFNISSGLMFTTSGGFVAVPNNRADGTI
jgi:hypothetical protein